MNTPQTVIPDPINEQTAPVWPAVERLEALLKVLGAAVALVVALGTPAVVFQFKGIGLPLQFMTREEIIRAGILPSIAIGVVVGLAYLGLGRQNKPQTAVPSDQQARLLTSATVAVVFNLLIAWSLFSFYVLRKLHLEYQPTFRASLHVGWRVRFVLVITFAAFAFFGRPIVKFVRRLARLVETPNEYRWARLGIALSLAASLFLEWLAKRVLLPGPAVESFLNVLEITLFLGLYLILITLAVDLRSRSSDDDRKKGVKQLVLVIVFLYCSAVSFYSLSWYRLLPHYLGGGKPVPVTIWVAKAAVADPLLLRCATANADFVRCEHLYLISVDADYYILALDATPTSRGLVLPRPAVGLISGALVANQQ